MRVSRAVERFFLLLLFTPKTRRERLHVRKKNKKNERSARENLITHVASRLFLNAFFFRLQGYDYNGTQRR